ncbi:MAG: ABC transporter permease [Hydrogenibacillus schlegelii]|nr:ABC transporter permease [Hydrogenibacillus schlegelii]
MFRYVVRRLLMLLPVLFGMSIVVFAIVHLIPGDPATTILGERASPQAIERLNVEYGLHEPLFVQYVLYLKRILTGDLGVSLRTGRPIAEEIGPYLAATVELSVASLLFAVVLGTNLGILSAWRQNSSFDVAAMLLALVGVSVPVFWLGLMEQWIFAEVLHWFPSSGRDNPRDPVNAITHLYLLDSLLAGRWDQFVDVARHLVLPGVALGTIPMAIIARITRSSMLEVLRSDYVRTARAKGVSSLWVVYKHALKNAFIPILTVIGMQFGFLLGGAVLTETIFGWPGIGRYIYEAISYRDYPVIQSGILVVATLFVLINLIVDLLYAWLDPRIQYR